MIKKILPLILLMTLLKCIVVQAEESATSLVRDYLEKTSIHDYYDQYKIPTAIRKILPLATSGKDLIKAIITSITLYEPYSRYADTFYDSILKAGLKHSYNFDLEKEEINQLKETLLKTASKWEINSVQGTLKYYARVLWGYSDGIEKKIREYLEQRSVHDYYDQYKIPAAIKKMLPLATSGRDLMRAIITAITHYKPYYRYADTFYDYILKAGLKHSYNFELEKEEINQLKETLRETSSRWELNSVQELLKYYVSVLWGK